MIHLLEKEAVQVAKIARNVEGQYLTRFAGTLRPLRRNAMSASAYCHR